MNIIKEVEVVLTKEEIDSPRDIQILIHVMSEDLENEESVTYTITYPKKQDNEN
jgi:hypothetical protein